MKVIVILKDPEGVHQAIESADYLTEEQKEQAYKWFKYKEYVDIVIDLENNTARIIKP